MIPMYYSHLLFFQNVLSTGPRSEDRGQIIKVPADLIRSRLNEKCQTTAVPPLVISKIEAIIKFIEKHNDTYTGVVTVH